MKKIILGLAVIFLLFSFTGCPSPNNGPETLTQILNAGGNVNLNNQKYTEDAAITTKGITVENADLGGKTLTVKAAGVTLKNITNANLVIAEDVGDGDVYIEACSFADVKVNGGGKDSIHFKTTIVTHVDVIKSSVRVVLEEGTKIENATINADNAKIEAKPAEGNTDASELPSVGTLEVAGNTSGVQIQKITATAIVLKKNVKNVTVEDVDVEKIEVKENANTTTIKGGVVRTIEVEKDVEKIKIEDCTVTKAEISNEAGNVEIAGGAVETLHVVTKTTTEIKTVITVSKEETIIRDAAIVVKDGEVTAEPLEVVVPEEIAGNVELPETVEQISIVGKYIEVRQLINEYKTGTKFDTSNIYLILEYSNGNENEIELDSSEIEVVGFDSSAATENQTVTLKTTYDGEEISTEIKVSILDMPKYVEQGISLILKENYDEGVERFRTYYDENPDSDEAKLFYALAEIAAISTDKSIAELLQKHFGIENYPAKMNSLLSLDWLEEYPERERVSIYKIKEDENGYFLRCDIDETDEKYEYYINYILDEDGDWIDAGSYEYIKHGNFTETVYRDLYITGVAKPSPTGKYLISEGNFRWPQPVNETEYKENIELPENTLLYNIDYDSDSRKYKISKNEFSLMPSIKMSEEFKNSKAYKNSLVKGIENTETISLAIISGFFECNPNGVNELIDDCIAVFDNEKISNARAIADSMNETIEIPSIIIDAFGLDEYLGEETVCIGKTEFNVILSTLDIIKGTLQFISSYDLSVNFYELKKALYEDTESLPDSTYINLINNNTLAARSDASARIEKARTSYTVALETILDSYEEMFGEEGYYPEGLKEMVNSYTGPYIKGVESLKDSIKNGTVFYLPGLTETNPIPSWELEVNPEKDIGIDFDKLFTPGYFTDILTKDNNGNGVIYSRVEYDLQYSCYNKPELLNLAPMPEFTKEEGDWYKYECDITEPIVLKSELDEEAVKQRVKAMFKESGYEHCYLDINWGYKLNLEKISSLLVNAPASFVPSSEEIISFDGNHYYMYIEYDDWKDN